MNRRPPGYTQPPGWKATRERILRRDHGRCYLCGKPGADTVDHINPVAEHGSHGDDNLAACHASPCHAEKTEAERVRAVARRARRRSPRRNPNLVD